MRFGNWNEKIHDEKEQRTRYSRACSSDKKFVSIDRQNQTGEFVGSEGDLYYVTLNDCSCQDFKKRGKPCKHIYQLAMELGYKKEDAPIENCEQSKLKKWLKTPADKIGFAIMLYGVISIIITQSANNGTSFGQSLLIGGIFVVIGLLVKKFGGKKKKEPVITSSVKVTNADEEQPSERYVFEPLPIDTSKYKHEAPTQKQLNYAAKLGIVVYPHMSKSDLSAVITKVEDNDMIVPDIGLLQFAQENGESPSPYLGLNNALHIATYHLNDKEICSFYLYCLYCSGLGKAIENLNSSELKEKFVSLGAELSQDAKAVDAIRNRPSSDFAKPNKRTTAYTSAVEYLKKI